MSIVFVDYEEDDPNRKMGSCKFRSPNKIEGNAGCCGGKRKISGYKCEKRDIFPLKSSICDQCAVFESKN